MIEPHPVDIVTMPFYDLVFFSNASWYEVDEYRVCGIVYDPNGRAIGKIRVDKDFSMKSDESKMIRDRDKNEIPMGWHPPHQDDPPMNPPTGGITVNPEPKVKGDEDENIQHEI